MIIRKPYFVVYEDNTIIISGALNDRLVETGQVPFNEFDTEEELSLFISENSLEINHENN